MTTLNTIIEEENTLDTEGEKEELVRKAERDIEFVVSNPDMYDISVQVKNIVRNLLTSRDTYWKERVRKEVEDYFDIRLEDLVNEHLLNEDPHTETRIFEAKKNRDEILTITNEDNLK